MANLNNRIIDQIIGEFSEDQDLRVLILYGSQANGTSHPDSDVDIAVLYTAPLSFNQHCSLMQRLGKALNKTIDLVDLYSMNGTILKQILTKGRVLTGRGSTEFEGLLSRMVYNQEDMMPYYNRSLEDRRMRFING